MSTTPAPTPQTPAGLPQGTPKKGVSIIVWILGGIAVFVFFCILAVVGLVYYGIHKAKQAGLDPDLMKKNPVYATFKMGATISPDTEIVSSDDDSGTLTIRSKKDGKVVVAKFDPDAKTMVFTDENGKTVNMKFDTSNHSMVVTDDTGKTAKITADDKAGNIEVQSSDGTFKMGANADKPPSWVPIYPGSNPTTTMSSNSKGEQAGTYVFNTQDSAEKVLTYYTDSLKGAGFKVSTTTTNTDGKAGGFVSGSSDADKKSVAITVGTDEKGTEVSVIYSSKS